MQKQKLSNIQCHPHVLLCFLRHWEGNLVHRNKWERERVKEKEGKKKIERDRKSFLERDRERERTKKSWETLRIWMNSSFNISSIALCLGKELCVQALSLFGVPLQSLRLCNKSNDKALGKSSDLFGCESTSRWEGTSLHCFHQWPSLSGLKNHHFLSKTNCESRHWPSYPQLSRMSLGWCFPKTLPKSEWSIQK